MALKKKGSTKKKDEPVLMRAVTNGSVWASDRDHAVYVGDEAMSDAPVVLEHPWLWEPADD